MLCGGQLVIFAVWVFHVPNSSLTGIINRMHKITFMHSMICILSLWLQCYITKETGEHVIIAGEDVEV